MSEREVLARGSIRVDARRAVAKLRQHLLVDLNDYVLELVRAAIACGAQQVDVRSEADELAVSWQGASMPIGKLTRLLDYVLGDVHTAASRRLRLLALGVNAALGLAPRAVELLVTSKAGRCKRIRFTPEMLEDDEASAPEASAEVIATPADLPPGHFRVRVVRKLGWQVLSRSLRLSSSREELALERACIDVPAKMTLNGGAWRSAHTPQVLHAVPLTLSSGLGCKVIRAELQLTTTGHEQPEIHFLEHGVMLARYTLPLENSGLLERMGGHFAPVRVVVDAHPLPTNASRSALREDAPLLADVAQAIQPALLVAMEQLIERVLARRGERAPAIDPSQQALGLWLNLAVGARPSTPLSDMLLSCPLVQDGCGRWRSYDQWRAAGTLYGLHAEQPLAEELALWARQIVWLRGQPAEQSIMPLIRGDAELIIKQAQQATARRAQLLAHPPMRPSLPDDPQHLTKEAFRVEDGPYTGLHGEVALRRGGGATVRVFVEQRPLCVLPLRAEVTPLAVDIALAWPERVIANFAYDGVEDNQQLVGATLYALFVAVKQAETLAKSGPPDDALRPLVQHAMVTCWVTPRALSFAEDTPLAFGAGSPLAQSPVWPTSDPRRHISLAELCQYARYGSAICYVHPSHTGVAPDGRPVIAVTAPIAEALAGIIGRLNHDTIELVPYQQGLSPLPDSGEPIPTSAQLGDAIKQLWMQRQQDGVTPGMPAMLVERPGVWAIIGPAPKSRKTVAHAGQALVSFPLPRTFGPIALLMDDITTIPSRHWDAIRWRRHAFGRVDLELELLHTVTLALAGDAQATQQLFDSSSGEPWRLPLVLPLMLRRYLLDSAEALRSRLERAGGSEGERTADIALERQLLDGIAALPLLHMLDAMGEPQSVTLRDLAQAHPAPARIPWLKAVPGFRTLEWRPLLITERAMVEGLGRWTQQRLRLETDSLGARQQDAWRALAHEHLLLQPPIDFDAPLAGAIDGLPRVHERDEETQAQLLLAIAETVSVELEVSISHQQRALASHALPRINLPLVARFDSPCAVHFKDWAQLDPEGVGALRILFDRALVALASQLVAAASDDHPLTAHRTMLVLRSALRRHAPNDSDREHIEKLRRMLRRRSCWPTVQGELRPLSALRRKSMSVYVAQERHFPWLRGKRIGELDRPILWSPEPGAAVTCDVLQSLGQPVRDVTAAVERLQQQRSRGSAGQAPKLPNSPAHPMLRVSLARLLVTLGEGELEVIEGRVSHITVIDLNGVHQIEPNEPPALKAMMRIEGLFDAAAPEVLVNALRSAAHRYLVSKMEHLDALPAYARSQLRAALLFRLERLQELSDEERAAPVFPEIKGAFFSIAQLEQQLSDSGHRKVWATTAPGPYPALPYGRPIVRLSEEELKPLRRVLSLVNQTRMLQRDLEAERRAQAPRLSSFTIPGEVRAVALAVGAVQSADLSGEVAVLDANAASLRDIHVAADGRPLCAITDGVGWPMYAVVNSRTARPNRFFDGLRNHDHAKSIRAEVRQVATGLLQQQLPAPADALASCWVRRQMPDGTVVEGRLWLPARWSAQLTVGLRGEGVAHGLARTPLVLARESWLLDHQLPVAGELLLDRIDDEIASLEAIAEALWDDVVALVQRAYQQRHEPGGMPLEVDCYLWDLALLGAVVPARATTTDGHEIDARALLDELGERGIIWWSEQRGSAEGQMPEQPPAFVLHQQPATGRAPVLRVLVARARLDSLLSELGGVLPRDAAAEASPDMNEQLLQWHANSASTAPPPHALHWNAAQPNAPQPNALHSNAAQTAQPHALHSNAPHPSTGQPEPEQPSWLGGLVRSVTEVFVDPKEHAPDEVPLVAQLRQRLRAVNLYGHPERAIGLTKRGRPISYRKSRLRLHLEHDKVAPHARAPEPHASTYLAAAALSELNRGHAEITSAEELYALILLMEGATPSSE